MVYFDNAATTFPKPLHVKASVEQYFTRYGANPGRGGYTMSMDTTTAVFDVRAQAADFFGACSPEQVVFTSNCTHALNIAIQGFLRRGDHVIISDLEHNSVLRPVHQLAQAGIITFSVAQTVPGDDKATVEAFCRCFRKNTRAVITTHASNVFGIILPIHALGKLCKARGVFFFVDAAQTAGVVPIDMARDGIDFLCTAGHKGLYGPTGTGLLITPHGKMLTPLLQGGAGSDSRSLSMPDYMPERLEAGTVNTCGILGLGAGLRFVCKRGMERIAAEEMAVIQTLYTGICHCPQVELYTPFPTTKVQTATLSFNLRGIPSEHAAGEIGKQGFAVRAGLQCSPLAHEKFGTAQTGTIRVSAGAFNTPPQASVLAKKILDLV